MVRVEQLRQMWRIFLCGSVMPAKRKFHDKEWREFLRRIGEGNSANQVCKQSDMPSWRLVSEKLNSDSDFAMRYSVAMENRGQVYADKIADIIEAVIDGRIDPNAGRVAIDGLKWTSARERTAVMKYAREPMSRRQQKARHHCTKPGCHRSAIANPLKSNNLNPIG